MKLGNDKIMPWTCEETFFFFLNSPPCLLSCFNIYDANWKNPSDVSKQHFKKWLELVIKLVYNSI